MDRLGAARQQKAHHVFPAGARRPCQRCRVELTIAEVDVGAAIEQPTGGFDGAFAGNDVESRHSHAVGFVGIDSVLEQ